MGGKKVHLHWIFLNKLKPGHTSTYSSHFQWNQTVNSRRQSKFVQQLCLILWHEPVQMTNHKPTVIMHSKRMKDALMLIWLHDPRVVTILPKYIYISFCIKRRTNNNCAILWGEKHQQQGEWSINHWKRIIYEIIFCKWFSFMWWY